MKIVQDMKILSQTSEFIEDVSEALDIIDKLNDALDNTVHGLGLAAIQIGIPKRVGVLTDTKGNRSFLINAVILDKDIETVYHDEGCLSFPKLYFNTNRHKVIEVECDDIEDGLFVRRKRFYCYDDDASALSNLSATYEHDIIIDKYLCIEVQHETDHFEGITFLERKAEGIEPIVAAEKVGRNDPCPCGSNKKYKKCCGG